jgi:hypothetical protein
MRQGLGRPATIVFLILVSIVVLSQTRLVGARPCTPTGVSAGRVGRGTALVSQTPCVGEYFSEGPLYNPTFTYSSSSLSFRIPAMVWSALGRAVYAPSTSEKVAPETTTYWFLHVSESSPAGRVHGSFVSSTSAALGPHDVLEYTVVSDRSGISWVAFPMPAQLVRIESAGGLPNSATGASAMAELVAQADVGAQVDSNGNGFFNGALQANAAATPSPLYTPAYYGYAVIAQATSAPTAQPGFISILNGITAGAGQVIPTYGNGQIAVGFPYTGARSGQGLTGLFTAGTAGNKPNPGNGVLTWGNGTGSDNWTQVGVSGGHDINGVWNTVIGILEIYQGTFNEIGCNMDAGANWGCGGGLFGNAYATPFPSENSATPLPTTYPSPYAGPAVIAQATSAPTAQPGYIKVTGTSVAGSHNACSASSGVPCEFTWSISSFSGGIGTTTVTVPEASICTVTATQSPIVASSDVMTTWVTGGQLATTLTVRAQDLLGTYSGSFAGNGNCD